MSTIDTARHAPCEYPLVCVCVPTYNAAGTVRETMASILGQSYPNLVVHISDNASTDDTVRIIESMEDPRVNLHRQEVNIGAEGNFTLCISLATGKYTAILHADDIYEPDMLAKEVAYLESNPDVGAVFTEAQTIDEHGVPLGAIGGVPGRSGENIRLDFRELLQIMLLHHNFLVCPSVLVRTEIYRDEICTWGSSVFKSASDVETWLRLASSRPIAVLNERLMRYRISSSQHSHLNRNRLERADFFLVMDHYLDQPEVRSFLTADDLRHYGWLERHERVARAMNLFIVGRQADAKALLPRLICKDSLYAAISNRRGLVTLGGGLLLRMLMLFGSSKKSMALVQFVKRLSWR